MGTLVGWYHNSQILELSHAHLPDGALGIYKHFLFSWWSTFFENKTPPTRNYFLWYGIGGNW